MIREISATEAFQWREQFARSEGFCFLDSSLRESLWGRYSLVSASPVDRMEGDISDISKIEVALAQFARGGERDLPFPVGALIGSIDYEGGFTFGVYPWAVITDHHLEKNWFVGPEPVLRPRGSQNTQHDPVPDGKWTSSFSPCEYEAGVRRIHEYIRAGDIYQVNLCQRFSRPWDGSNLRELYQNLREISPASFSGFLDQGSRQILSSSPELFLKMSGRHCLTRPIKGTRPRFADAIRDEQSAFELIRSEKDLAELIMITDLERNDLGQFCEHGSVKVTDLVKLEKFAQVFHLVSTVEGIATHTVSQPRALQFIFPGGSITGAPKKRAMEIIRELESTPRGLYTGAIGYFGFNGESAFNIAIRSLVYEKGMLHFGVGAGITIDSDPEREYEETLHKAKGMMIACERTLGSGVPDRQKEHIL